MDTMDFDKRAPMGFLGMRGKKDYDKKVPMEFQSMRGKRNTEQKVGIDTVFETRSSGNYQGK